MKKGRSFTILLLLGIFTLSILTPTFAQETQSSASLKFTVKVSDHAIGLSPDYVETWLYLRNPSKLMERDGTTIYHKVVINHLTIYFEHPDGETTWFFDPYNPEHWGHDRWKTEILPGEETLVFFIGYEYAIPGIWAYKYTLNVEYEGETFDLVCTFNIIVND